MKSIFVIVLVIVGVLLAGYLYMRRNGVSAPEPEATVLDNLQGESGVNTNMEKKMSEPPKMQLVDGMQYFALLKTNEGDIKIELYSDKTPITVNNFVALAKEDFYDGTKFHRVIKDFMLQGGDPNGDGTGGPGYKFDDEPFEGEYARGTVAMANSGPNTNGSQFFIMHKDYPLPPDYVIFGKVTEGIDVVDKIAEAPKTMNAGGEMAVLVTPVIVSDVEIIEGRN